MLNGYRVSLGTMKAIWKWVVVMAARHHEFFFFFDTVNVLNCNVHLKNSSLGFPSGSVVKNLPANAEDTGSVLELGRSHMPQRN